MAQESRKKDRIFFSYKEATAGTADTDEFFEGRGLMTFPEPTWLGESDYGKLGSGEYGKKNELQAIWTPWSYKPERLSEVAYLLSFFMGQTDNVTSVTTVDNHRLRHLPVSSRTLPTFTFEYGTGTANRVCAGNVINDFSLTLATGGNGKIDATFNGWGNRHYVTGGALTELPAGSMSTAEQDFSLEPLVNFKCTNLYMSTALEAGFGQGSIDFSGSDLLATVVDLSSLLNTITITGNNGMSGEDQLRAAGCGVINNFERNDPRYTLEFGLRKNDTTIDTDALILADTTKAFEVLFNGNYIAGTDPYAIDLFFPNVQILGGAEDDESPINRAVTTEVFQDSNANSMIAYVQSSVAVGYNAVK